MDKNLAETPSGVVKNIRGKITVCASGTLLKEAKQWQERLKNSGYEVIKIPRPLKHNYAKIHRLHYKKIAESNALFVLNLKKGGIANYIGPSVFAEMAFAIGLNLVSNKHIKVFHLNPLPKDLPYSHELRQWEKLGWIEKWKKL